MISLIGGIYNTVQVAGVTDGYKVKNNQGGSLGTPLHEIHACIMVTHKINDDDLKFYLIEKFARIACVLGKNMKSARSQRAR